VSRGVASSCLWWGKGSAVSVWLCGRGCGVGLSRLLYTLVAGKLRFTNFCYPPSSITTPSSSSKPVTYQLGSAAASSYHLRSFSVSLMLVWRLACPRGALHPTHRGWRLHSHSQDPFAHHLDPVLYLFFYIRFSYILGLGLCLVFSAIPHSLATPLSESGCHAQGYRRVFFILSTLSIFTLSNIHSLLRGPAYTVAAVMKGAACAPLRRRLP
jgi:hypothetical protein